LSSLCKTIFFLAVRIGASQCDGTDSDKTQWNPRFCARCGSWATVLRISQERSLKQSANFAAAASAR
jgi:hypothetical protein